MEETTDLLESQQESPASEKHTVSSIKDRYLTFELEKEKYGVEILSVKEIIGLQKTIHVPQTPYYVKGIMNLRGQIIPVINLRLKLGMEEIEPEMDTAVIIVMIGKLHVGFIVDRVIEVAGIKEENLSAAPQFGATVDTRFLRHMAQHGKDVIMILALDAIFASDELHGIQQISKETNNTQGKAS